MDSRRLARLAMDALDGLKGQSILSIDVSGLTTITDRMVIATGRSVTHVNALTDAVLEKAKAAGVRIAGVEGRPHCEWVLVDAGGVVVHIMLAGAREFYNLEDMWGFEAPARDAPGDGAAGR